LAAWREEEKWVIISQKNHLNILDFHQPTVRPEFIVGSMITSFKCREMLTKSYTLICE
jgi:hypothetical protein